MRISENIKRLRQEQNLTQQEVADKLFVTRQCISRWESGKTIPDIESMEKLSQVFNCTINDIFEEKALKELAIKHTKIQKVQNRHVLLLSISSIFLLIGLVVSVWFLNDRLQARPNNIKYGSMAIIHEIRRNTNEYVVSLEDKPEVMYTIRLKENADIYLNNELEPIMIHEFSVFDVIYIEYIDDIMDSNITKMILVDEAKTDNLLGIVFVSNGVEYQTLSELQQALNVVTRGIRFYKNSKRDGSASYSHNFGMESASRIETYTEYDNRVMGEKVEIDLTLYYDDLKLTTSLKLGLIYESGIYYQNINLDLYFEGEIQYETENPYKHHSEKYTYSLTILPVRSYEYFIVYEYDEDHVLVSETTISEWSLMRAFNPHPDAFYSQVHVYTNTSNTDTPNITYEPHLLYVGDSLVLNFHDGEGLVYKEYFYYQ